MKYSGKDFRKFYKHIVTIEVNEGIRKVIGNLNGGETADIVYAYGYIDHEAGFTFEVLATGNHSDNRKPIDQIEGNDKSCVKLRAGSVQGLEISFIADEARYRTKFAKKIKTIEYYNVSKEIEETRSFGFLDEARHDYFIDDVAVFLVKEGNNPERCWVRIEGLDPEKHRIIGTLLNEPNQDFGYHVHDTITFFVQKTDDNQVLCIADLNDSLNNEEEAEGSRLEKAVTRFYQERNERNFINVLEILCDSYVWIPCKAKMSERDEKRFAEMIGDVEEDEETLSKRLLGKRFVTLDDTRLVPDILQNGDDFFFPIFSTAEAMGEYGYKFSKVAKHILEVLPLARNNSKQPIGLVLNAFSEPLVIPKDFWDLLEEMKSGSGEE